ncbi:hypothetical protein B0H19DRAFT_574816 [Mycena capillaripes]|nr:hypothetical protein B0H19DRAFT_574816 [Mycena capillaripes]
MEQLCWKCRAPAMGPVDLPGVLSRDPTHLLQSNDVPLESDIPFLRDIISARTRGESAELVRQYRAVLSPVRSVPPELICEILALAWFSEEGDMTSMTRSPPWHFGCISRAWRYAALSYTPFWCSITILSSPTFQTRHLLETQLLRSRNAPLRVYWRAKEYAEPDFLKPVVAQCKRWSALHLDFQFVSGAACLDWLRPAIGRLTQLQKLAVSSSDIALPVSDMFLSTLALREVILTDPEFNVPSPLSISIPWPQLTRYRGMYSVHRQMEILNAASNLVECAVGFTGFGTFTDNPHDLIVLAHLRRLCVKGPAVLSKLKAPLLQTLCSLKNPILRTLLPFVERSACTLTKLVLMECDISDSLIVVLRGLPTLTYLLIDSQLDDGLRPQSALFDAMTTFGTSSDLCPNLTSLLYAYERPSDEEGFDSPVEQDLDFPRDHFFNMVQSRLEPNRSCRLEFLRIFYTPWSHLPPSTGIVARLKALQDAQDEEFNAAFLNYRDFEASRARGDFF